MGWNFLRCRCSDRVRRDRARGDLLGRRSFQHRRRLSTKRGDQSWSHWNDLVRGCRARARVPVALPADADVLYAARLTTGCARVYAPRFRMGGLRQEPKLPAVLGREELDETQPNEEEQGGCAQSDDRPFRDPRDVPILRLCRRLSCHMVIVCGPGCPLMDRGLDTSSITRSVRIPVRPSTVDSSNAPTRRSDGA